MTWVVEASGAWRPAVRYTPEGAIDIALGLEPTEGWVVRDDTGQRLGPFDLDIAERVAAGLQVTDRIIAAWRRAELAAVLGALLEPRAPPPAPPTHAEQRAARERRLGLSDGPYPQLEKHRP